MEVSEFDEGFSKLKKNYGERYFPQERETLMWNRYRKLPRGEFLAALDGILLHMPPHASLIERLDACLKDSIATASEPPSRFACEPCRDLGYGFVENTLVRCVCSTGQGLHPEELAEAQDAYNRGGKYLRKGPIPKALLPELPYDKHERMEF